MVPSDWFNKGPNGQYLGRKRLVGTPRDREDSGKKKGRHHRDAECVGHIEWERDKVHTVECRLIKWANLSYKS